MFLDTLAPALSFSVHIFAFVPFVCFTCCMEREIIDGCWMDGLGWGIRMGGRLVVSVSWWMTLPTYKLGTWNMERYLQCGKRSIKCDFSSPFLDASDEPFGGTLPRVDCLIGVSG